MVTRAVVIILVTIFLSNGFESKGQSKEELERQRRETQEIIENTTRLLRQTGVTRQSSLQQLNLVNRRLQLRKNLISTIESEIETIDRSIVERQDKIRDLEEELKESREAYARLINIAFKHRFSHQRIMFILSAEDFNQAYRRYKYLEQYAKSRQKQIVRIGEITDAIVDEVERLESQRNEKIILLNERQNETAVLNRERVQQNNIVQDLRKRENELKSQLAEQEKVMQALQRAIEELLREEARIAAERRIYELTPAEKLISDQFQNNKGGLPWPIERGVVTGFFGEHPHPVLRGIYVQNNGIDISTVENAEVKALFSGTVRQVRTVPGLNNVILIRHGNYLTVYANLSHVFVRADDNVNTGQMIGRVYTDPDEDKRAVLHLEIWEENKKLDPLLWLSQ